MDLEKWNYNIVYSRTKFETKLSSWNTYKLSKIIKKLF